MSRSVNSQTFVECLSLNDALAYGRRLCHLHFFKPAVKLVTTVTESLTCCAMR
jgi:hypothetical protein